MGGVARDVALLDLLQEQRQTNALLRQVASGGVATAGTGAASSGALSLAQTLAALRTPGEVFQVLMAAGRRGDVDPLYARTVHQAPAGTQQTFVDPVPKGMVAYVVGVHRMQVTPDLAKATITHFDDNNPAPIINQAAGLGPVELVGPFFRPVRYNVTHVVRGDPDLDVEFIDEIQGVLIKTEVVARTIEPMLAQWYNAIRQAFGG